VQLEAGECLHTFAATRIPLTYVPRDNCVRTISIKIRIMKSNLFNELDKKRKERYQVLYRRKRSDDKHWLHWSTNILSVWKKKRKRQIGRSAIYQRRDNRHENDIIRPILCSEVFAVRAGNEISYFSFFFFLFFLHFIWYPDCGLQRMFMSWYQKTGIVPM